MRTHRQREAELEREGWVRQFVAGEPRLSEAADMYRELGFEVHLEPLPSDLDCETCGGTEGGAECRACFDGVEHLYRVIYTRPYKGDKAAENGLF
ncbi:MAG: hypothetical protein EHM26_07395 [Desulfobacteraceae bacterium]|nr:MAG: hypothetical protein EHM26_07395 [Desulfobacteraceae bacterium]